jgi:hypothetical protein
MDHWKKRKNECEGLGAGVCLECCREEWDLLSEDREVSGDGVRCAKLGVAEDGLQSK